MFHVFNDTNPPAVNTVFFTGPPGSGLTNSPADPAFGLVQDGTNVYYLSPAVRNPAIAQGGTWTVTYRNSQNLFSVPDPQVLSHMAIPVPTVTLTNGQIAAIRWTYTTSTGSLWPGLPSFITQARIDLFDPSSNPLDSEVVPPASTFVYPAANQFAWQNIGAVRMGYYDALTNQYFFNFTESAPTLTGTGTVAGGKYQFSMNGAPGQNYTIQFATSLANGQWNTLYVTNSLTSPIQIVDPTPTNATRFYRVLVGP